MGQRFWFAILCLCAIILGSSVCWAETERSKDHREDLRGTLEVRAGRGPDYAGLTTTTTAPPAPPTTARASRAKPSAPKAQAAVRPLQGDPFDAIAQCESGGRPDAVSRNGRYHGAFQFSLGTWRSLGAPGVPTDHDYATQKSWAIKLQARSGWGQWPHCSAKLGLR